jgi:hypothetical protein
MHWDMRAFVNRANCGRELLHALTAAVKAVADCFANDRIGRIDYAAVRANRTVRPADSFEMLPSSGFVIEDRVGKIDRLSSSVVEPSISNPILFVKCIVAPFLRSKDWRFDTKGWLHFSPGRGF